MQSANPQQVTPQTPVENQPTLQPSNNKLKLLYAAIGVLTVGLLATTSALAYLLLNQPSQLVQTTETTAPETQLSDSQESVSPQSGSQADEKADWKTYTSSEGNFQIKYPEDWTISDNSEYVDLYQDGNVEYRQDITIEKKGYQFRSRNPLAWGPAVCIFPDSPSYEGPSNVYSDYIEIESDTSLYRRAKTPNEQNIFTICAPEKGNSQVYTTVAAFGGASYLVPENYDEQTLKTLDQILSTFEFTSSTTSNSLPSIPLASTQGWKQVSLASISFLIPSNAKYELVDDQCQQDCSGLVYLSDSNGTIASVPSVTISTSDYLGGSRRDQFWGNSTDKTICNPLNQEANFGQVKALQIAIDSEQCQGGGGGIVAVVGGQLVVVKNLQRNPNNKSQILRFDTRDTIVSTLKSN